MSTIGTFRSALSNYLPKKDGHNVGDHPRVVGFMKGLKNLRPATPRYTETWDTDTVIAFLKDYDHSNLKELSLKMTMILALVAGQRAQTLGKLKLSDMRMEQDKITFRISEALKTKLPGTAVVTFVKYEENPNICPVELLKMYIDKTSSIRTEDSLIISYLKPYKAVHVDTIRRWIMTVLALSGIDVERFKAHSVRSASTSKANAKHVPIDIIMEAGMWSNKSTFAKFYNKPIVQDADRGKKLYNDAILNIKCDK